MAKVFTQTAPQVPANNEAFERRKADTVGFINLQFAGKPADVVFPLLGSNPVHVKIASMLEQGIDEEKVIAAVTSLLVVKSIQLRKAEGEVSASTQGVLDMLDAIS